MILSENYWPKWKTIKQLEDDVSLPYLIENAQNLALIRRELFENAHEGGRLIHAYELQNPSSKMMIRSSQPLRPFTTLLDQLHSSKLTPSHSKSRYNCLVMHWNTMR